MSFEDYKKIVDYYLIRKENVWADLMLPVSAVVVALSSFLFTILWSRRERKRQLCDSILKAWDELISCFSANPILLDFKFISEYPKLKPYEIKFLYDSICYKTWGLFRRIVDNKLDEEPHYASICQWIVSYHVHWLEHNPIFFPEETFWTKVSIYKSQPVSILSSMPLPRKKEADKEGRYDGSIDWNLIAADYHKFILGPFAPEMIKPDSKGYTRNKLIDVLNSYPEEDFQQLTILEIGCGPGNLIKALKRKPLKLIGVDLSDEALEIAKRIATEKGINFEGICQDFRKLDVNETFDIAISINSILPDSRDEIVCILENIRAVLKPNGILHAILPSFDTTQYLRGLWYEHYNKLFKSEKHAQRCVNQIDSYKLVDKDQCFYADDGVHKQAYHTPDTINKEFKEAGLLITTGPVKIYYPWELTRRFDYGYFPSASEEIWDWYVVAQKGSK